MSDVAADVMTLISRKTGGKAVFPDYRLQRDLRLSPVERMALFDALEAGFEIVFGRTAMTALGPDPLVADIVKLVEARVRGEAAADA